MKKAFLLGILLCFITTLAFAQMAAPTVSSEQVTLKGEITDNMCAPKQKPEDMANFLKTHTKECILTPSCAAAGYSIFADGKLIKFDSASNAKVEEFLKKADSKLQVVVVAKKVGDELSLVSIENQK